MAHHSAFCFSFARGLRIRRYRRHRRTFRRRICLDLWFNIPPARFYISDTGTMGLTLALAVVAFMTDDLGGGVGVSVLPIIGALLVATVASDIIQVISKKFFRRKIFRIAPLHHHFEAIGWPGYKVVMRYWVLSVAFAFAGVIIAIVSI